MGLSPAIHRDTLRAPALKKATKRKRPDVFQCAWGVYELDKHPHIIEHWLEWNRMLLVKPPPMLTSGLPEFAGLLPAPVPGRNFHEKPVDPPKSAKKRQFIVMGSITKKYGVSRFTIYCPAAVIHEVVIKAEIYGRVEHIDRERECIRVAIIEDAVISRDMLRSALDQLTIDERRAA